MMSFMVNLILQGIKTLAFRHKSVSKMLSQYSIGRLAFRSSMALKRLFLFFGLWSQRAVEYPWVLKQLSLLRQNALVLDVGCSESLLSHELIAKKYRVVGIDINEYPFQNNRMLFIKRNILNTGFPNGIFDGIVMVSLLNT